LLGIIHLLYVALEPLRSWRCEAGNLATCLRFAKVFVVSLNQGSELISLIASLGLPALRFLWKTVRCRSL